MQIPEKAVLVDAPWKLSGNAFAMLYRFPKEWVMENGFMEDFQKNRYLGYLGVVMVVNYEDSNVGKYQELLFIPGLFTFNWSKVFSISKIYVSSQESIFNGWHNWGIPKEKADFEKVNSDNGFKTFRASIEKKPFFEVSFGKSFLSFPLKSNWLSFKIGQKIEKDLYITDFNFSGKLKFTRIKKIKIDSAFFPEVSLFKPLLSVEICDFKMDFGKAKINKCYFEK